MSATVTYKGSMLTTVENETKKLSTAGTWLEDDITIEDVTSGGVNKWVRPADWPDIESLVPFGTAAFSSFDGVYLTLDNTGNHAPWIKFWAKTSSGKYVVERGHIANGVFVTDDSAETNSDSYYLNGFENCGYTYPIYFVHAKTSGEHLTLVALRSMTSSETGITTTSQIYGTETGVLECVGHVGYCGNLGGNGSNQLNGNKCMVREHLVFGDKIKVTDLSNAFSFMNSLEELDLTGFDTSNWEVALLNSCFNGAINLRYLDLSNWNTSKWAVTSMQNCFNGCYSLKELDLSDWDTSNWAVTNMDACFNYLVSLEVLDLSGWDTSDFALTTFKGNFGVMNKLKICKISAIPYTLTTNVTYPSGYSMRELYPMTLYANLNYSNNHDISRASLLRIIAALPNGNYTLSLGRTNLAKLTSAEIAVATNKGWTVN